ncbi:MAG: hypothetical protein ACRDDW_07895 [Candidatus Rhabdochlamydia sp.]
MSFSTNPFSSRDMTNRALIQGALNNHRHQCEKLHERRTPSSSESESDEESKKVVRSQVYMDMQKRLCKEQRSTGASTNSSFSSRNVKKNDTPHSQAYIDMKNHLFSMSSRKQRSSGESANSANLRGRMNSNVYTNTTKSKDYCSIQ